MKKEKILSASRIKTLESCSWSYYCNYELKIPQRQNEGALRGTICHLVFELILKPKHNHHKQLITQASSIDGSPAVKRLVIKKLNEDKRLHDLPMDSEENYDLVDRMIVVGLKYDFFGEGGEVTDPEKEFLIESENPKYKIRGFMDKPIIYNSDNTIKIVDYKSSKQKFKGEELTANIQAMSYSLASLKFWPKYKPIIEFLFLRFPKSAVQQCEFSKDELEGFEYFLESCFKQINSFNEKDAKSNYAKDGKNSWMCKAGRTWRCPYLDAFDYYTLEDEEGKAIASARKKENLDASKGHKIVKKTYGGCPAHPQPTKKLDVIDELFDF